MLFLTTESSFLEYIKRTTELMQQLEESTQLNSQDKDALYDRFFVDHAEYAKLPPESRQPYSTRTYVIEFNEKIEMVEKQLATDKNLIEITRILLEQLRIAVARPKLQMYITVPDELFLVLHGLNDIGENE